MTGADDLRKLMALIRQQFGVDPNKLDDEQFTKLGAEAIWLKDYEFNILKNAVRQGVYEAITGETL